MATAPPTNAGDTRTQEARITRSLRAAFTAVLLMSLGSLVEISSLLTNSMGFIALAFFIHTFVLDRRLSRQVCGKGEP